MVKRVFDILLVVATAPLWGMLLLGCAGAVLLCCGRPVFFTQQRPGFQGKPFLLRKLRTLREGPGSDVDRMTAVGRFLRSTSLDELPELINVLRGEMSLVGPRPLLMQYLPRYTPEQMRRHAVKPGLTGWAQIHGRNALSWEEKFAYDVWYVEHGSFWLDLRILALTVWRVVTRQGINADEGTTMTEFMGTANKDSV